MFCDVLIYLVSNYIQDKNSIAGALCVSTTENLTPKVTVTLSRLVKLINALKYGE